MADEVVRYKCTLETFRPTILYPCQWFDWERDSDLIVDRNSDPDRSRPAPTIPGTLASPFYTQWWFWLLVAGGVGTGAYFLLRKKP